MRPGGWHDHAHDHDEGRRPSKKELEREARARAREMVARSQIRQYPEPVLREPARPVSEFSDDLRALVKRMVAGSAIYDQRSPGEAWRALTALVADA